MSDELIGTLLGLFSALTLALANLQVKRGGDILAGRAALSLSSGLFVLPGAFFVPAPTAATWSALAVAVPVHFGYQLCLVRAMERGDLSLVFPVMRGLAPLLTAGAAFVVLGERLGPVPVAGLLLATGAVAAFALLPAGGSLLRHPDRAALGWAAATAVGVALYNASDARGVRVSPSPFTYIVWIFLFDPICITLTAARRRRGRFVADLREQWRGGAVAGLLSVLSFGAALYAFSLMEAARVSALRETAVVWAAALGAWLLKEGLGARRIAAAAVLAGGLALMQFGG